MEVPSVISRNRLSDNHGWHLWRPDSSSAKLREAGAISSERTDSATVKNQIHAPRLPFLFGAVSKIESAQVVAANASAGPIGPSSASSCARYASSASAFARLSSSSSNAFVATRETLSPASRARTAMSSGTVIFTRDMRILYTLATADRSACRVPLRADEYQR